MVPPKALLVTTAKNEAPYFLEWVAHHLELGFTDIVVFQNDSDDLTDPILSSLRDIGAIQYRYNRAGPGRHQINAYDRVSKLPVYADCDWAMALAMDEFLVVKTGDGRLSDLIQAARATDCIDLNQRFFGNSGYETITDQLVTERFAMADHPLGRDDQFAPFRCLFRTAVFARPGPHRPHAVEADESRLRYTNGSGLAASEYKLEDGRASDPGGCKLAQINHYAVREVAGFMLKSAWGGERKGKQAGPKQYWATRNTNFEIDDSMQPYLARVKARMQALNDAADGKLLPLRERAIFRHMARYYTLLEEAPMRDLRKFCKDTPNAVGRKLKAELAEVKSETALVKLAAPRKKAASVAKTSAETSGKTPASETPKATATTRKTTTRKTTAKAAT